MQIGEIWKSKITGLRVKIEHIREDMGLVFWTAWFQRGWQPTQKSIFLESMEKEVYDKNR